MSIKNALKRLELQVSKNSNKRPVTFVIPYSRDKEKTKEIMQELIKEYCLEASAQVIFVLDFSTAKAA